MGIAVTSHVSGTLGEAVVEKVEGSANLLLPVEPRGSSIATWAEVKISPLVYDFGLLWDTVGGLIIVILNEAKNLLGERYPCGDSSLRSK